MGQNSIFLLGFCCGSCTGADVHGGFFGGWLFEMPRSPRPGRTGEVGIGYPRPRPGTGLPWAKGLGPCWGGFGGEGVLWEKLQRLGDWRAHWGWGLVARGAGGGG